MSRSPMRAFAALLWCCAATTLQAAEPACQSTQIAGFNQPESVFESADAIYVSNIGGAAGNGYISKVDKYSLRVEVPRFLPVEGGFDKPMGLLVADGILYVADLKRVRGYDLKTRAAVFELSIPGARSLNDLVLGSSPGGEVWFFASDYYANKVFKVYPKRKTYSVFANVVGANGLAYDAASRNLYVAGLGGASTSGERPPYAGALYQLTARGQVTRLIDTGAFLDGIALHRGRLYFSDWGTDLVSGRLHSIPIAGPKVVRDEALCAGVVRGPADFTRSRDGLNWLIPALMDGKVVVEPIR